MTVDQDDDAVSETVTLTHTATVGEDDVTLSNSSVTVTITDTNPDRGVTVSTPTLAVPEAGRNSYMVKLESKPTGTVTVDIGGASGEVTVSPSRLVFMPDDYGDKEVFVYAGEDFDGDHDTVELTHTVRGGDYTGVSAEPSTVKVTVGDNDPRGVTVTPETLNIVAGSSDAYTVVLNTQPARTVYITVADDSDDVTPSRSSLSFSTSNWNRPQSVTVRVAAGATTGVSANLSHAVETTSNSRDKGYDEVESIQGVEVSIVADAPTRLTLSRSSTLTIDEGRSAEYTVRLYSEPQTDVRVAVGVVPSDGDVVAEPPSLTFTTDNWNQTRTVTVTANEDDDAVSDTATLTHTVDSETVVSRELAVTVRDNDTRGVSVTPTSFEVKEGASGTYSVVLDTEPTGNVTVTVNGASGDVTVTPSQLTFVVAPNEENAWFKAQTVTVNAANDPDGEQDDAVTLTHTVRGADYDRIRVDNVRVTIREDETLGVTVTRDSLMITEGDTDTYEVKLEAQPTGTVTVMVRGASGDVTVKPSRLIFTTSSWDDLQPVEVKAGQDADGEHDAAVTLTHAASGGGYDGVTGGMVTVTTTDDDPKGVTVTPRALTVMEGSAASSYTVVLTTEPTGTVTVTLGGLAWPTRMTSLWW